MLWLSFPCSTRGSMNVGDQDQTYFQIQIMRLCEVMKNGNSWKVKKSAGASNDDKNLAFVTTSGVSSTNNINTVNPEVSTATNNRNVSTAIEWDILPENAEHLEVKTTEIGIKIKVAYYSLLNDIVQKGEEDLDDLQHMDLGGITYLKVEVFIRRLTSWGSYVAIFVLS
ncbi:hypothetical protein Tco_0969797 [Tanacetum coccineum]